MVVTAIRIPVPDPIAPIISAKTVSSPIMTPPSAAAVGMYLYKCLIMDSSFGFPSMYKSFSTKFLTTSLG